MKYEILPYKNEYRTKSGVYQIRNKITGKVYVGSSATLGLRRNQHFSDLRHNRHPNKHLQRSFNKRGESNYVFEVLELCPEDMRIEREQYWIDALDATKKGYNLSEIADKPQPQIGKDNFKASSVILLETKEVWDTVREAAEAAGVDRNTVGNCCNKSNKTCVSGHWMYYDEYLKTPEDKIQEYLSNKINRKSVICLETLEIYKGICEASDALEIRRGNILNCCEHRRRTVSGYHFMYMEEYEKATPEELDKYINGTWIRKIIKLSTGEIFKDKKECSEKCHVDRKTIYGHCNFKVTKPEFMYLDEYEKLSEDEIQGLLAREIVRVDNSKPVKCIETGEVFKSGKIAAEVKGTSKASISNCCLGKQKTAGKLHWQFA